MSKLRVLVVEDSLTVRRYLVDALGADPGLEVVGEAEDGQRGFELCQALRPDVVTMDMMLPGMTGVTATEHIMAYCPTPILVVSSSYNRGELFRTYDALAAGAVDVLDKPSGELHDDGWNERLIAAVKLVARIKVITHPRARLAGLGAARSPSRPGLRPLLDPAPAAPALPPLLPLTPGQRVVAIGVSTGGPGALVEVLSSLPADFDVPVLVVLHLSGQFSSAFPEWLEGRSGRRVAFARDRELLADLGGKVVLAPPDRHLVVHGRQLRLTQDPERHSCRPSVDVLFESLAHTLGLATTACLMTGMGKDGAEGLLGLRKAGAFTIAQDEATSIIFGMPREAILLGAAMRVLPLSEIGRALAEHARRPAEVPR